MESYGLLAEQYWVIYGALEAAGEAMRADSVDHPFVIDELRGPGREPRLTVLPATAVNAERLRSTSAGRRSGMTGA